ncbi:MAG: hypothetical protein JNM10_03205 [Planctomycetia bacterium]|nr:hypothetical protein [Planctomycetia bacterium]
MVLAAGFFVTFLIFLALGLGALVVTAALDRALGKERGLFLWSFALLAMAFLLRAEAPKQVNVSPQALKLSAAVDPSKALQLSPQVFARSELARGLRNAFQEQSDTRPLPPERLPEPPSVGLAFPLPATIPGVAPAGRRVYRVAEPPKVTMGDGSKLPDVPPDAYVSWTPQPEDVFDWIVANGSRVYIYIRAVDGVKEGSARWEDPKSPRWNLALKGATPTFEKSWENLQVEFAYLGNEEQARKFVATPRKARGQSVATLEGSKHEQWFLRRTVDNLFVEACRRAGNPVMSALGVEGLRAVAAEMATVGQSGKEDGKGWRKAIEALELALAKCAAERREPTEVLEALIDAYRAVHDETRLMATLASFLSTASGNAVAEGSTWVGDLFLQRLRLADRADAYYARALETTKGLKEALVGRGDALGYMGDHAGALKAYRQAADSGRGELAVREAEALLRLGDLAGAKAAAEQALGADAYDVRALLVKGAAQYAAGDVAGARDAFAQAAVLPGDGAAGAGARRHRAEALFDLGLAEWRLGHGDAATAAFDAAEKALRAGAQRGRHPDETVSAELGRALLQLGQGNADEASAALDRAREQAERCAYVEFLAGWVARQQGDAPRARGRFEAALGLAPDYHELDGWLAETRLSVAQLAVSEGRPLAEAGADFQAAVSFAERAAATELAALKGDLKANPDLAIRLALTQVQNQRLPERRRFEAALKTAEDVLAKVRDERRALAIKGYCNYRLGVNDPSRYDQCLRDFQAVVDVQGSGEDDPWRKYAAASRKTVTRWLSLEEKTIEFAESQLPSDWELSQSHGIRVGPDEGWLVYRDQNRSAGASDDGNDADPTVSAKNKKLFGKESLETVQVWLSIPKRDTSVNKVVFGVVVQPPSGAGKGLGRNQGIGVFYNRGKVALRIGGGADPLYKDGSMKAVMKDGAEMEWPDDGGAVLVEIQRSGDDGTQLTVRLNGQELVSDKVSAFRRARGEQELWLGGWSAKAEKWDIRIDKVRVVRTK